MIQKLSKASPLDGSVLVLNRFFMAVHVISVRRALVLLYRDLAEVVDVDEGKFYNYDFHAWVELSELLDETMNDSSAEIPCSETELEMVRSVSMAIRVPRILRLVNYDQVPKQSLRFNRRNLFARDGNRCQYCYKVFPLSKLSFDHVIPRSRGGATSWENVVCCCLNCNGKKSDRLPEEAGLKLRKKPARPKQNPLLHSKMNNPKYESWRTFITPTSSALEVQS